MNKLFLPIILSIALGGCAVFSYKEFTDQQMSEYTTCSASLQEVKSRLVNAGYDTMTDKKQFFITDWKVDNSKSVTELYGKGKLFRKYKIRELWSSSDSSIIQWIEFKSIGRNDNKMTENDLYLAGPEDTMARQEAVVRMICGPLE